MRNMKKEQGVSILYTILGSIIGYLSLSLNDFISLLLLVLGIYLVSIIPLKKKISIEKVWRWIFSNTFITYILSWLIVYLLLSNLV